MVKLARDDTLLPVTSPTVTASNSRPEHSFELDEFKDDLEVFNFDEETQRIVAGHDRDAEVEEEEAGLLTGERKDSLPQDNILVLDPNSKNWLKRPSLRFVLLSFLALIALLLVGLFFHPASPVAKYYGSDPILPGLFTPDSIDSLAANPLPTNSTYGDVPFASIGKPWSDQDKVPHWAGGVDKNHKAGFEKTVIVVSLDGVRSDYLERGLTPHLLNISRKGLRAKHLIPAFPSLTFPDHWSLLTGLHPSSHGIIANDFHEPVLNEEFKYSSPATSWPGKWWKGEPIWATAVKYGLRAAVLFWPGPPELSDGTRPSRWYAFQNNYDYHKKLALIEGWLDEPHSTRPQLILAYAPEVDQEGHRTGPHSKKVEETLSLVDDFAHQIFLALEKRSLTDIVDVIFVSDHGMAETSHDRMIFLDDILGMDDFNSILTNDGWPAAGLRFKPNVSEPLMLAKLLAASQISNSGFNVYTPETMPTKWFFTNPTNQRLSPIFMVPDVGWVITSHHQFEVEMGGVYRPKGAHGYDNYDPSMQAIFVAHGPFAESLKSIARKKKKRDAISGGVQGGVEDETSIIDHFSNLELYPLMARLLGIPEVNWAQTNSTPGFWDKYLRTT